MVLTELPDATANVVLIATMVGANLSNNAMGSVDRLRRATENDVRSRAVMGNVGLISNVMASAGRIRLVMANDVSSVMTESVVLSKAVTASAGHTHLVMANVGLIVMTESVVRLGTRRLRLGRETQGLETRVPTVGSMIVAIVAHSKAAKASADHTHHVTANVVLSITRRLRLGRETQGLETRVPAVGSMIVAIVVRSGTRRLRLSRETQGLETRVPTVGSTAMTMIVVRSRAVMVSESPSNCAMASVGLIVMTVSAGHSSSAMANVAHSRAAMVSANHSSNATASVDPIRLAMVNVVLIVMTANVVRLGSRRLRLGRETQGLETRVLAGGSTIAASVELTEMTASANRSNSETANVVHLGSGMANANHSNAVTTNHHGKEPIYPSTTISNTACCPERLVSLFGA